MTWEMLIQAIQLKKKKKKVIMNNIQQGLHENRSVKNWIVKFTKWIAKKNVQK